MHVQYVCWAELLYIQLLTPQASFLGHLGGILAGLLHVHVFERLTLSGTGALPGFRCGFLSCTGSSCCVQTHHMWCEATALLQHLHVPSACAEGPVLCLFSAWL